MRRLLVIGFLLYSGTIAAQTDDRRVRTVEIDDGQVRAGQADERRVRAPEPAIQSEKRRVRAPERAVQPDEREDGAEHPDEHMVLARQLVDLGQDGGSPPESAASCVPEAEAMRADILVAYRAHPEDFHGISPRSTYWRDVEQAWHDYYVDRCAAQNEDSPAAIITRIYAANLSTEELREVVAFQESPAGRAFVAAARLARQDLESAPAAPAQRDTDEASARFREAMLRLKAKYERAPR